VFGQMMQAIDDYALIINPKRDAHQELTQIINHKRKSRE
jgi:hypothetical protein